MTCTGWMENLATNRVFYNLICTGRFVLDIRATQPCHQKRDFVKLQVAAYTVVVLAKSFYFLVGTSYFEVSSIHQT